MRKEAEDADEEAMKNMVWGKGLVQMEEKAALAKRCLLPLARPLASLRESSSWVNTFVVRPVTETVHYAGWKPKKPNRLLGPSTTKISM